MQRPFLFFRDGRGFPAKNDHWSYTPHPVRNYSHNIHLAHRWILNPGSKKPRKIRLFREYTPHTRHTPVHAYFKKSAAHAQNNRDDHRNITFMLCSFQYYMMQFLILFCRRKGCQVLLLDTMPTPNKLHKLKYYNQYVIFYLQL